MIKKQLTLIVCLVVAAALSLTGYLVVRGALSTDDTGVEVEAVNLAITGHAKDDRLTEITTMTLDNSYGVWSFSPDPTENGVDSACWYIHNLHDARSDKNAVDDIAQAFYADINPVSVLEVPTAELGSYGLADPAATVTFEFDNGDVIRYSFGIPLSLADDNGGYYMMRTGDDTVYLVESYYYEKANSSLESTVELQLTEDIDTSYTITDLRLWGSEMSEEIDLQYNEKTGKTVMVKPVQRGTDSYALSLLLTSMSGLEASSVLSAYSDAVPESVLAQTGFNNVKRAITLTYYIDENVTDEEGNVTGTNRVTTTVELRVGLVYGGSAFVMKDDVPIIYLVPESYISEWYTATVDELADRLIYVANIITVDEITFDTSFKTFDYDVTATTSLTDVTLNGKEIDIATFQNVYLQFIGIAYIERTSNAPSGTAEMRITVKLTDGTVDTVEFIKANSRRYWAVVNGQSGILVSYDTVESLLSTLKASDKGTL